MLFNDFLKISFELSEIKTWRNFPNSYKYNNFTELNHFFNKTSIFLIISLLLKEKYNININYEIFKNISLGYLLSRYALKDINVNLFQDINKNYLTDYIKTFYKEEGINLTDYEIKSLNTY